VADLIVSADQFATFLNVSTIDPARATLMLDLAVAECSAYVAPLTDAALGVVLSVAARAYAAPTMAATESVGPFSVSRPAGGVYLTRSERRTLQRISGRGGAFSVDPTPADAGQGLAPWDQNVTWLTEVPFAEDAEQR
jgi:hypothetical protein